MHSYEFILRKTFSYLQLMVKWWSLPHKLCPSCQCCQAGSGTFDQERQLTPLKSWILFQVYLSHVFITMKYIYSFIKDVASDCAGTLTSCPSLLKRVQYLHTSLDPSYL